MLLGLVVWLLKHVLVQAAIAREAADDVHAVSDDGEPTACLQLRFRVERILSTSLFSLLPARTLLQAAQAYDCRQLHID